MRSKGTASELETRRRIAATTSRVRSCRSSCCGIAAINNRDGQDCEVKLWDTEPGRDLLSLTATGVRGSGLNFTPMLGFSPDGHRLTLYHEGGEYVWDATPRPEPKK